MKKTLVTGGAGCIGSELAERLLLRGEEVVVLDNLSSGRAEHIEPLRRFPGFQFIEGDLLDPATAASALEGAGFVYHLAANPNAKFTPGDPTDTDLQENVLATYHVLDAMRQHGVGKIAFTSTSAVYGVMGDGPIPEDASPMRPISLYGAAKLGCEALLSAFQHLFGMEVWVFRLANIASSRVRRYGRTVIADFICQLREHPDHLDILGDGRQAKSYLGSAECVDAMLFAVEHAGGPWNVLNLGCEDRITVDRVAELVVEMMGLSSVSFRHTGGEGGWPGDVPRFLLDVSAMERLGWRAQYTSEQAVRRAITGILAAEGVCRP
jgi:UDP-glucose 4-epimerase